MSYADYEPLLSVARNLDKAKPVAKEVMARYQGILPDGLLEFWARHGNQLVFGDGYIQMCDPALFEPVISSWFDGDPEFEPDRLIVYGLGYSGDLMICDGSTHNISVDVQGSEFRRDRFNSPPKTGENYLDFFLAHVFKLGTVTPRFIDKNDIFNEAVTKHGPLAQGEMFTWVPPLQLAKMGNRIEKVDAEVQISILQELGPLKYIADKFTDDGIYMGTEFKRFIGPQR
jgi:hypothetical protein